MTFAEEWAALRTRLDALVLDVAKFAARVDAQAEIVAELETALRGSSTKPPIVAPAAPPPAFGGPSGVANVAALVAAGIAVRGARGDDGRLTFTQYGGKADRTPDANSNAGIGNRGNRLGPLSLALSPDLIATHRLKGGERIAVSVHGVTYELGTYDDTTGDHTHTNVIDVYDPGDVLGNDDFLASIPAGTWLLVIDGAAAPHSFAGAIVAAAEARVGKPFPYDPATDAGNLGCADVVSTILIDAGALTGSPILSVAALAARLQKDGWQRLVGNAWLAGDVVRWAATPQSGGHEHVGVIVSASEVVQNVSRDKAVERTPIGDRPVVEGWRRAS